MIDMDIIFGVFCIIFTVLCVIYGYNSFLIAEEKQDKPLFIFGTVLILASPFICTIGIRFFVQAGVIVFQ